jgi:hypothetical protein
MRGLMIVRVGSRQTRNADDRPAVSQDRKNSVVRWVSV